MAEAALVKGCVEVCCHCLWGGGQMLGQEGCKGCCTFPWTRSIKWRAVVWVHVVLLSLGVILEFIAVYAIPYDPNNEHRNERLVPFFVIAAVLLSSLIVCTCYCCMEGGPPPFLTAVKRPPPPDNGESGRATKAADQPSEKDSEHKHHSHHHGKSASDRADSHKHHGKDSHKDRSKKDSHRHHHKASSHARRRGSSDELSGLSTDSRRSSPRGHHAHGGARDNHRRYDNHHHRSYSDDYYYSDDIPRRPVHDRHVSHNSTQYHSGRASPASLGRSGGRDRSPRDIERPYY